MNLGNGFVQGRNGEVRRYVHAASSCGRMPIEEEVSDEASEASDEPDVHWMRKQFQFIRERCSLVEDDEEDEENVAYMLEAAHEICQCAKGILQRLGDCFGFGEVEDWDEQMSSSDLFQNIFDITKDVLLRQIFGKEVLDDDDGEAGPAAHRIVCATRRIEKKLFPLVETRLVYESDDEISAAFTLRTSEPGSQRSEFTEDTSFSECESLAEDRREDEWSRVAELVSHSMAKVHSSNLEKARGCLEEVLGASHQCDSDNLHSDEMVTLSRLRDDLTKSLVELEESLLSEGRGGNEASTFNVCEQALPCSQKMVFSACQVAPGRFAHSAPFSLSQERMIGRL